MLKGIAGAVVGYIVIIIVVMAGLGLAWAILGGEGAFHGDGPYPSTAWLAFSFGFGFLAAVAGGFVAAKIGAKKGVQILVGLIIALGLVSALTYERVRAKSEPIDKPVADMTFTEAGEHARQPPWYNWTIPIVGVVGALVGGRRKADPDAV